MILDGFYATVAAKDGGVVAVHRSGQVIDATAEARTRGVFPGMGLREARSILSGEGHFIEWSEDAYCGARDRWLHIVARYSDVVEPVDQHEAFVDLSAHPRPRESAAKLQENLSRLPVTVRVGVGACRWVARLAASWPDHYGLAQSDPRTYVSALPVQRLPIDPGHASTLCLLGYRSAREVAALEDSTLRSQFGSYAIGIRRAAMGEGDAHVSAVYPPDAAASRHAFEGGAVHNRQTIDEVLGRLAVSLGEELRSADRAGKRMEIFLEFEDSSVQRLSRTFARSITSAADVLNAARLLLASDPERPPEAIRIRLPGLTHAKRVQLDIEGGRSKKEREAGAKAAVNHVLGTYGDKAIILAKDKNEPRWMKVRRAYQEANGYVWCS